MKAIVLRGLYTTILTTLIPFIFLRLWWRGRKSPLYRTKWAERLGWVTPISSDKSPIWFHLVSLGETRAATPLIQAYQKAHPEALVVITNTTPTGYEATRKAFGSRVVQYYFPYDLPSCWARFLKRVHPQKVVIMETEIWPNLLTQLSRRNIAAFIVNGRLSPGSFGRYLKIKNWLQVLLRFVKIAAQSPLDADKFQKIGATHVEMLGNVKYDMDLPAHLAADMGALKMLLGNRPTWIAASTHAGEEALILEAHQKICVHVPDALLVLVPRHPERFKEVATLCASKGMPCVARSQKISVPASCAVFLGDTLGEMLCFLGVSHAACVGGSFASIGGHNTLEPALLHVPVCVGPHTFNFVDITKALFEAGGLVKVDSSETLSETIVQWLQNPPLAAQVGEKAFQVIAQNRGAVERIVRFIG